MSWRLVLIDKVVTLHELETSWSIMDVVNATEILQAIGDAQA
jgi:hypothetical protein